MNTLIPPNQKVVIDSIGTACPSVSSLLSESFQLPQELVLKMLYTAPSVLLEDVEPELAQQTHGLLEKLGLEVTLKDKAEKTPKNSALYDISIYIDEIEKLPRVISQVCGFLGCDVKEATHLLLQVPSTILGGVSQATAEAFSKRIDAQVIISDPKKDLYMLDTTGIDDLGKRQLEELLNRKITSNFVYDIDYQTTQKIWSGLQSNKHIKITNQSHHRFELVVDQSVDHPDQQRIFTDDVGMPSEIIDEVLESLPVQLFASLDNLEAHQKKESYALAGLTCSVHPVLYKEHEILINQLDYDEEVIRILSNFFAEKDLPKAGKHWVSPYVLPTVLAEYIAFHLERLDCTYEVK